MRRILDHHLVFAPALRSDAKGLISALLTEDPVLRPTVLDAFGTPWMKRLQAELNIPDRPTSALPPSSSHPSSPTMLIPGSQTSCVHPPAAASSSATPVQPCHYIQTVPDLLGVPQGNTIHPVHTEQGAAAPPAIQAVPTLQAVQTMKTIQNGNEIPRPPSRQQNTPNAQNPPTKPPKSRLGQSLAGGHKPLDPWATSRLQAKDTNAKCPPTAANNSGSADESCISISEEFATSPPF